MTYSDVTLTPDDIRFERWPDREHMKDVIHDDDLFAGFVEEHGPRVALELVTEFHRIIANQLIVRAVSKYTGRGWSGRTIRLCRAAKHRRNQARRILSDLIGWDAAGEVIGLLDEVYPRAVWGSDE